LRGVAPSVVMPALRTGQATQLLQRIAEGDRDAAAELLPLVYGELHELAEHFMRGHAAGHTLQPTALVHEAYVRLLGTDASPEWESRSHFFGVAAKAMRSVLVDHARRRGAEKRGGGAERVPLEELVDLYEEHSSDLLALDDALTRLSVMDAELARIVELRFFGGLSVEETARTVGVSEPTIVRGWRVARMWLMREMSPGTK
jgi:RNA polymerase sigma-70 factor (ECF subfamily)